MNSNKCIIIGKNSDYPGKKFVVEGGILDIKVENGKLLVYTKDGSPAGMIFNMKHPNIPDSQDPELVSNEKIIKWLEKEVYDPTCTVVKVTKANLKAEKNSIVLVASLNIKEEKDQEEPNKETSISNENEEIKEDEQNTQVESEICDDYSISPLEVLEYEESMASTISHVAVYAGSFDPITNGHLDIIQKAAKSFDKVIIAVAQNEEKESYLTIEDRKKLVEIAIEGIHLKNVEIKTLENELLTDFMKREHIMHSVRGLRFSEDFIDEQRLYLINKSLYPEMEVHYFMCDIELIHVSSSAVRTLMSYNSSLEGFVPLAVEQALKKIKA